MATAGPSFAGTGADDATVGAYAWSNPGNITATDAVTSNATMDASGGITHYLKATNFGFAIPVGATINGITVDINRRSQGSADAKDFSLKIVKGGAISGTDLADTSTFWPSSLGVATYGGVSSLWGLTWLPSDINASNFGVVIAAKDYMASVGSTRVDDIKITITYTAPPSPSPNVPPLFRIYRFGDQINLGHPIANGLVGMWMLNEGAGAIAHDLSGHGNNGTLVNGLSWSASSVQFDGTDDYVDLGTPSVLNPAAITISAWVKFNSLSNSYTAIVSKVENSVSGPYHQIFVKSNGKLAMYVYGTTAISYDGTGTITLSTGIWYHLALTYDSISGLKGYVNGALDKSVGANGVLKTSSNSVITTIGKDTFSAGRVMSGYIDDVRIYNRALFASEIWEIYTRPSAIFISSRGSIINRLVPPAGILFDSAGNSGDVAAASSYSGSATWNGSNRMLAIDVSMLGAGVTVTAMTYGGAACSLVGVQSTVTSFGSIEQWRIIQSDSGAPAAGSNTLAVTLSGSLEFSVEWASYTGVHQTSPTEGFNSTQATNAGSATDASVAVTSVADNCWIHAAVTANDTSITAGQNSRNNISGTLGSGGNEDTGPVTPAGATTMSYTGMGITTTWAIAGYAIRPIAASSLGTVVRRFLTLLGVS